MYAITWRLIRSVDDTGIICCLDSRTSKYIRDIKRTLPFKKYTTNLEDVDNFARKKLQ